MTPTVNAMSLPLIVDSKSVQAALSLQTASGSPRYKVLDLRPAEVHAAGHIPGARHLPGALLNRAEKPFAGLLPDNAGIQALIEAADLRQDDHVIAVDAGRSTEAARLIWVLQAWGFMATSWLDGGMAAWSADGGTLSTTPAESTQDDASDRYTPHLIARNRASADELLNELETPALRVLDVRGAAEFAGTDVRSAEGGHVPGARHMEWTQQLDADGRLVDTKQLRAALTDLDVLPEHRVVAYCQSHQRSAVTWLILTSLGYADVRGLDGAWSVWGNKPELPKET